MSVVFAFFSGLILALGLVCPLGITNVFILNQGAVAPTYRNTIPVSLTASLSDTMMILISVLGVSLALLKYPFLKNGLIVFEIAFLIYVGFRMWRAQFKLSKEIVARPIKQQVFFTLGIFFLNPHAYLDTIGVIGVTATIYPKPEKIAFTSAVILVSWIWFFSLSALGRMMRKFEPLYKVQGKISAVVMWLSALFVAKLFMGS